jgi:ribosomal protein L12E/L44/L45/RPP1/RPP2
VRGGKLLREDALEAAAAKPAKKPTAKKPASGSAKKPAKSKPKPKPQGQLGADLKKKREKYSQKDLLAGLQLLIPIVGALFASGGLGSLLGGLFGGGGANATRSEAGVASALQSVDIDELLTAAANAYDSLGDEQKFQMRAVVTWVQNGFQLPEEAGA